MRTGALGGTNSSEASLCKHADLPTCILILVRSLPTCLILVRSLPTCLILVRSITSHSPQCLSLLSYLGFNRDLDDLKSELEGLPDYLTEFACKLVEARALNTDLNVAGKRRPILGMNLRLAIMQEDAIPPNVNVAVFYVPQIGYLLATPKGPQTPDLSNLSGYTAHDLTEIQGIDWMFDTKVERTIKVH